MRRLCGVRLGFVLSALVAEVQPAAQQVGTQTGSIEFVARATPTAGRAEPAMRLTFYLLRKSFAEIQKEAAESEPKVDLDRFEEGLEVSKELKAWMKRTRWVQLTGSEFMRRVTVNDILEVPEFFEAYLRRNAGDISVGFPSPKYRERDRTQNPQRYEKQVQDYHDQIHKFIEANPHTRNGMDLHLADIDPGQRWARQDAERRRRIRDRWLELAQTRYLVAKTETNLEGHAMLMGILPGAYWLSTLEGEAVAGDVRLRWDTPVAVRAGQVTRLELSNVNAVQPERPAK